MVNEYDIIVIGAGSAGMSAAIYAHRFGLKTLLVGKVVGGLLNDSHKVENYPGFTAISGFDLMMKFKEHVDSFGIETKEEFATNVVKSGDEFTVTTENGEYRAKAVVLTLGTKHRHLGIPGEEKLQGRGVSYCATCDGAFFKNVPVAVVGGGDSAAQAALLLAQHASQVYILVRKDAMRAEPINRQRLEHTKNVTILYKTEAKEVLGENGVEGVKLTTPFNGSDVLKVEGFFVETGAEVQNELAIKLGVTLNERKELIVDEHARTNIKNVYAAGDCTSSKYKQAITGAAGGVIAAYSAFEDLR